MKLPLITAMHGLQFDGKDTVTLSFKSSDGRTHYVPLRVGVLNALAAPVISAAKGMLPPTDGVDVQALTLTSFRPMLLGIRPAMEIGLDGVPLRVVLPDGAIPALRKALDELDALVSQSGSQSRH